MLTRFDGPEVSRAVLGGMQDGVVLLDPDGVHLLANPAFHRLFGFEHEELVGRKPPFLYWAPEETAAIVAALARALAGEATSFELLFNTKWDERVPVIVAPSAVRDEEGTLVGYVATVKDIRERRKLEKALVESEQRWRSIAENPFDFVVVIDREYIYRFVNHTAPGITLESLIGKATPFDFTASEFHPLLREAYETTFETGRATNYEVYSAQTGAWYASIVGPIYENGRVATLSILTREITQQKLAEEALFRARQTAHEAQKMEAIGALAGGIAHDLNNLLTPIFAYAELARGAADPDHPVQPYLRSIDAVADRAAQLVQQILQFSRRQTPDKQVLDLGEQVRQTVALLRVTVPPEIEIELDLPEAPVGVLADQTQLDQVLVNLASNALQAMQGQSGRLLFRVRAPATPTAGEARSPRAAEQVELSVADTGPGMDATTQRRAFEPFFTTKGPGSGTGMGLAIVNGIVHNHGGRITIVSAPGQGATISVLLPRVLLGPTSSRPAKPPLVEVEHRALRILCVDDQPEVVAVVCAILARGGHAAHPMTSPQAALELCRAQPDAFDLVVTDQSMPGLTGIQLIAALRALNPRQACVLMTGLPDPEMLDQARALGLSPVLTKPFAPATLLAAVERAAHAAAAAR